MAPPFRFVHCADVHLDTPYRSQSPELRKVLRDAGRKAFENVVELCLDQEVHALLIAGDFFDNDRLSFTTEAFLATQLSRVTNAGISVVLATGNHDPGQRQFRAHQIAWPTERFYLLRDHEPKEINILNRDGTVVGRVVGAGHQSAGDTKNLASTYPQAKGEEPTVGILHTQVENTLGDEAHKKYAPCTRADLARVDYSYWALGHVHQRQRVTDLPPSWYPGNLQGRHHGERGAKGALLVSVGRGLEAETQFVPLAEIGWETLELGALGSVMNLNDILLAAQHSFEQLLQESEFAPSMGWMLRISLKGPCPLTPELRNKEALEELEEQLQSHLDVLAVEVRDEGLTLPIDLETYRGQPHLLGTVLEVLEDALEDDLLLDRLSPSPLAGFAGKDTEDQRTYLRQLLVNLDLRAAESLLRKDD